MSIDNIFNKQKGIYGQGVNGNAKEWVKAYKGLRQGDLLPPFLFNTVVDVISRLVVRAKERSIQGVSSK